MIHLQKPRVFKPIYEVASVCCEYEDKLLLLLRQDDKSEGNKWGIPAGKIDPGETPIHAIARELQEETSIKKEIKDFLFLTTFYVKYREYDFIFHMFRTILDKQYEIIINRSESKDFTWVTPKDALRKVLVKDNAQCLKHVYFS